MARLFISIDLPENVRDAISDLYEALTGVRWTNDNQLHLTLRFIGEVDSVTENDIISSLKNVPIEPFTLTVKGTGYFPPRQEPRILWVGISECKELILLQNRIENALSALALKPETRKFHPHISIGRVTDGHRERIAHFINKHNLFNCEPFSVSEFHLYRSYLKKDGAVHIKEVTFSSSEL
jgi:2'-5' RNA ligase